MGSAKAFAGTCNTKVLGIIIAIFIILDRVKGGSAGYIPCFCAQMAFWRQTVLYTG